VLELADTQHLVCLLTVGALATTLNISQYVISVIVLPVKKNGPYTLSLVTAQNVQTLELF